MLKIITAIIVLTFVNASQELEYIYNNPLKVGTVEEAGKYIHSSAKVYHYRKQCGLIKIAFCYNSMLVLNYKRDYKLRTAMGKRINN